MGSVAVCGQTPLADRGGPNLRGSVPLGLASDRHGSEVGGGSPTRCRH